MFDVDGKQLFDKESTQEQNTLNEDTMKKIFAPIIALLLVITLTDRAGAANYVFTGEDIYGSCSHAVRGLDRTAEEYDDHRFGVCAGFIAGIIDFHTVATTVESLSTEMFCLPSGISTSQVIRDVTGYLEENPERHHDLAAYLVILALRDAYPCQEPEPEQ